MNPTMLTVKQLAKLAGVTPRTLHHYPTIGLLKPSRIGDNGYRDHGEYSLLRLQQILFHRELDISLDDIERIMGRCDFDVLGALQSHKDALRKQVGRLNRLIRTVEPTIDHLPSLGYTQGNPSTTTSSHVTGDTFPWASRYWTCRLNVLQLMGGV